MEGESGMHKKRQNTMRRKRAGKAGLLFGVCMLTAGCVNPVVSPEVTNTPVPTPPAVFTPTAQPEPTLPPEITKLPESPTPEPTKEPVVTAEPTEVPELSPHPTTVPVTEAPDATPTPEPVASPEPAVSATPLPDPTGIPEYDALLQNGWQRTEDFFGCREIFFSGKWKNTELIAVPGRYEYRYTAEAAEEGSLSIIGEESLPVQLFLDELTAEREACRIEPEGENDYCYYYTAEEISVNGRVYACIAGGTEHRMRVEVRYPADEPARTEGYDFYLR